MVRNSTTPCETTVNSPTGRNVMQDGQKFNNTLRDNDQLTNWTECHARWSEIQQHLVRRRLTHSLDRMSCEMVRNSITPCETTVDSLARRNIMRNGQKFNNTLRDDGRLTDWTECHPRWSEIQQHLARRWSTHRLDGMSSKMVRNSITPCETTVDSLPGQIVMQDGHKFNNTLWVDGRLTDWTECHVRWLEIQQHFARRRSTHQLDRMSCKMVRNSTTRQSTHFLDRMSWEMVRIQQHFASRWLTHQLDRMSWEMVRNSTPCESMVNSLAGRNVMGNSTTPCESTVDSLPGQNVMGDGQKFNNTLRDDGQLTNWTECHPRWSEIQQHLVRWRLTHQLDEMSCKMVRNSTTPCDSWDDGRLTSWTECHPRRSEILQHLARRWSTHLLDKMSCEMVRNSTTPCETTVDSFAGWNVMQDGQKFNNTLRDGGQLTDWTNFRTILFITQCHLSSSNTHRLENNPCISFLLTWLPLSLTSFPYIYPISAEIIPLYAVTHILSHPWVSQVANSTGNSSLTS